MAKGVGKIFEEEFKASVPPDYYLNRLKDDTAGFSGVSNPCDFQIYGYPLFFLFELKSHKGKSIPLDKIRPNQIQGMDKAVQHKGVYGGFLLNFRDLEETYYISVNLVIEFINRKERKSIPVDYCREVGIKVEQVKKRTRYTYDIASLLGGFYE